MQNIFELGHDGSDGDVVETGREAKKEVCGRRDAYNGTEEGDERKESDSGSESTSSRDDSEEQGKDIRTEWMTIKIEDCIQSTEVFESLLENIMFVLCEPITLGFFPFFTHGKDTVADDIDPKRTEPEVGNEADSSDVATPERSQDGPPVPVQDGGPGGTKCKEENDARGSSSTDRIETETGGDCDEDKKDLKKIEDDENDCTKSPSEVAPARCQIGACNEWGLKYLNLLQDIQSESPDSIEKRNKFKKAVIYMMYGEVEVLYREASSALLEFCFCRHDGTVHTAFPCRNYSTII